MTVNGTLSSFSIASVSTIGSYWSCAFSGASFGCHNSSAPLTAGAALVINITANSSSDGAHDVVLNATGSLGGVVNITSDYLTIQKGATLSASPNTMNINQTRQFNLTFTNTGLFNITAVNGTVPSALNSFNLSSDIFGTCINATNKAFGCSNGSLLQPGQSTLLILWANATNSASGGYNITANYTTASFIGNVTPVGLSIQEAAQLNITAISFSSSTPVVGSSFSVTATAQNTGGATATGVILTLSISSGCTLSSGQSSVTLSSPNLAAGASGTASWSATCDTADSAVTFTVGYRTNSSGDNYDNNTCAVIPSNKLIAKSASITPASSSSSSNAGAGGGGVTPDPSLALTFSADTITLKLGESKDVKLTIKLNNPPSSGYLTNLVLTTPTPSCCDVSSDFDSYTTVNSTGRIFVITVRAKLGATPGDYNLNFAATAGNNRQGSKTLKVTIQAPDSTPPAITITSPKNQTYNNFTVPIEYSISEATSSVSYSLDGGANVTLSGKTAATLDKEGSHSITIYAKDNAGNVGKASIFFSINLTAGPPANDTVSTTLEVLIKDLNSTLSSVNSVIASMENSAIANASREKADEAALLIRQAQTAFAAGNFTLARNLADQAQVILDGIQGSVPLSLSTAGTSFDFGKYTLPAAAIICLVAAGLIIKSRSSGLKKQTKYASIKRNLAEKASVSAILKEIASEVNEPKTRKPKD